MRAIVPSVAKGYALTTLVTLLAAHVASTAAEESNSINVNYMRKYWSGDTNFAKDDRAILTTRGVGEDMGSDKIRIVCMAKGSGDTVQEPVTFADVHSSLVRISTRAACVFSGSDGILGRPSWSTTPGLVGLNATDGKNSTTRRLLVANSAKSTKCGTPEPKCCAVAEHVSKGAKRADGLPVCTNPTTLPKTDSWYGEYHADIYSQFTFKVSMVNSVELSEIHKDGIKATWTIEPAHGVDAKVVTPPGFSTSDAGNPHGVRYGAKFASNGHSPWALYDGGVMVTANIGSDLTYRLFMFKNDAALATGKKDPENAGLPYAHPFPGANGCNAEVRLDRGVCAHTGGEGRGVACCPAGVDSIPRRVVRNQACMHVPRF